MDICKIIKIGCVKKGITLSELAKAIGMSKQNLSNKMTRNNFKSNDVDKICEVLEITQKFLDKEGKEI